MEQTNIECPICKKRNVYKLTSGMYYCKNCDGNFIPKRRK